MSIYYIVKVLRKDKESVDALYEKRFELNELEKALDCVSNLQRYVDRKSFTIEIVKWVDDAEDRVVFAIQEVFMITKPYCKRLQELYKKEVTKWLSTGANREPMRYAEWYENVYRRGHATEHDRTGKNKRPAEFYTKEFVCGKTSIARRDFEEMPVAMDTYDFDDKTMQAIADHTEKNMVTNFGANYDLTDDDINSAWWAEMEGVALDFGMNYYEDYDEDVEY